MGGQWRIQMEGKRTTKQGRGSGAGAKGWKCDTILAWRGQGGQPTPFAEGLFNLSTPSTGKSQQGAGRRPLLRAHALGLLVSEAALRLRHQTSCKQAAGGRGLFPKHGLRMQRGTRASTATHCLLVAVMESSGWCDQQVHCSSWEWMGLCGAGGCL